MVKAIVIAAFKVSKPNSIAYRKYQTPRAAGMALEKIIRELEPDYISVRVIKDVECQANS